MRQGYSLRRLAEQTGGLVSPQTLHSWENGKSIPRVGDPLAATAFVLRVTVLYLLTGDDS